MRRSSLAVFLPFVLVMAGAFLVSPADLLAVTDTSMTATTTTPRKLNGIQAKKGTIMQIKKELPGGPDTTPPTVKITDPQPGTIKGKNVLFKADASDKGGIQRVELYLNGQWLDSPVKPPYQTEVDSTKLPEGSFPQFEAKAFDNAANFKSDVLQVHVQNAPPADKTKPTVTLTHPKANQPVEGKITLIAEATDDVGVDKVEFWVGQKPLGPGKFEQGAYWVHWQTDIDIDGPATVTATAYDKAGNSESASAQVTIRNNYDKAAPQVSLTSPQANKELSGEIKVSADATDDVGVDRVEFIGELGIDLGKDFTAPYEVTWDTEATKTPDGPAMAMAVAYDKTGNKTEAKVIFQLKNQNYHAVKITPTPAGGSIVQGVTQVKLGLQPFDNVESIWITQATGKATSITMGNPTEFTWDLTGVQDGPGSFTAEVRAPKGKIIGVDSFFYTVQNPKDATPPKASFLSPSNGATLTGPVTIEVEATDDIGMDWVNIGNGADFFEQVKGPGPNYKATWNTLGSKDGSYTITATAVDKSHNLKDIQLNVKVENDADAPLCEIAEPTDGADVSGESVKVRVNASDNKALENVQIYPAYQQGPIPGWSSPTPPYEVTFNSKLLQDGWIPIVAVAVDKAGHETRAQIKVKVVNNPWHAVDFKTSPAENSPVKGAVDLQVTCTPNDTGVAYLTFNGDNGKKVMGGNPFQYQWDTIGLANGQQHLTISAFDKDDKQMGARTLFYDVQN